MNIRLLAIAALLCLHAVGQAQARDPFQAIAPANTAAAAASNQTQAAPANPPAAQGSTPPPISVAERKAAVGNQNQPAQGNSASAQGGAPQPISLADRTAAIRKARHPEQSPASSSLTPEQRGAITESGARYRNDFFHFEILRPRQWEFNTAGRIDGSEGRASLNPSPQPGGSQARVWGMGDGTGRNVMLSITPLASDAPSDLKQLAAAMKTSTLAQLPSAQASEETVVLGDSARPFAAFRYAFSANDFRLVQSVQLTKAHGFLLVFTATGGSDEGVSDALRILSASLSW